MGSPRSRGFSANRYPSVKKPPQQCRWLFRMRPRPLRQHGVPAFARTTVSPMAETTAFRPTAPNTVVLANAGTPFASGTRSTLKSHRSNAGGFFTCAAPAGAANSHHKPAITSLPCVTDCGSAFGSAGADLATTWAGAAGVAVGTLLPPATCLSLRYSASTREP
jgi:hypothetical protein